MIPPATATAPPEICRSRISSAPNANRMSAVMTAIATIRRPYGALSRCIEVLGLFEERHQGDLWPHADEQEQEQLRH